MTCRSTAILLGLVAMLGITHASVAAASSGKSEAPAGSENNLPLDTLTVSVFSDNRVRGLMTVDLSLDLGNSDKLGEIQKILPRLRDRYVTSLTRFAANRVDVNRAIDISSMTKLLQDVTDEVLGARTARVLIGGATVRRS